MIGETVSATGRSVLPLLSLGLALPGCSSGPSAGAKAAKARQIYEVSASGHADSYAAKVAPAEIQALNDLRASASTNDALDKSHAVVAQFRTDADQVGQAICEDIKSDRAKPGVKGSQDSDQTRHGNIAGVRSVISAVADRLINGALALQQPMRDQVLTFRGVGGCDGQSRSDGHMPPPVL